MTLIVSYVWNNKIITMSDSRISSTDEFGKIKHSTDSSTKITPLGNEFVIGQSGLRKYPIPGGQYLDTMDITQHFIKQNSRQSFSKYTGEEIFSGLVKTWNSTLDNPVIGTHHKPLEFTLLMGKWEEENSLLYPKIYSYSTTSNKIVCTSHGISIGDQEGLDIINPYFNDELSNMDFEEVIAHFKKGFQEVCEKVDSVGGFIHTYILDADSLGSRWHDFKFFDVNEEK